MGAEKGSCSVLIEIHPLRFPAHGEANKRKRVALSGEHSLITTTDWYAYGHGNHSGFPYQSNHPNATETDFWKEMYIQYNTRDMVKRFGEAVLQYIKRQMK